jgi:hypothetical protein
MTKVLRAILGSILICIGGNIGYAQSLVINLTNGNTDQYALSKIQRITFSSDYLDMIIKEIDGTIITIPLTSIKYYNHISTVTSINKLSDNLTEADVKVYPNPSKGNFNIQYQLTEPGTVTITIIDVNGRIVKQISEEQNVAGTYNAFLSGINNGFQNGIYSCIVSVNNKKVTKKIIINN